MCPAEQLCHGRPFGEVSAEQYERDGALILARPLTLKGCQVVLVAVSYSGGREIVGEPVGPAVSRAGPPRVQARAAGSGTRAACGPPAVAQRSAVMDLPPLVLVHRPDRLPLDAADGRTMRFHGQRSAGAALPDHRGTAPGEHQTEWVADLTGVSGYVRLFVHDGGRRGGRPIAVLDPLMANPCGSCHRRRRFPQVQW